MSLLVRPAACVRVSLLVRSDIADPDSHDVGSLLIILSSIGDMWAKALHERTSSSLEGSFELELPLLWIQESYMVRTSLSHLIRIAELAVGTQGGAIGITFAPGNFQEVALTGSWAWDIDTDLAAIRAWGAATSSR